MPELTDEDRATLDATVEDMMAHPEKIAEIGSWELIYLAGLRAGRERQREEDARIANSFKVNDRPHHNVAILIADAIRKSAEPPNGEPTAKPIEYALRQALREHCIVEDCHCQGVEGKDTHRCYQCGSEWRHGYAEQHTINCLAKMK